MSIFTFETINNGDSR